MRALLSAVAVSLALASPAFACDMAEYDEVSPADLIADARESLDDGHHDDAAFYARKVAFDDHAKTSLRAEAFAIAAVARWKMGEIEAAKKNLERARTLDETVADRVVSKLKRSDEKALLAALDGGEG